jgi:hypothetical protein
VESSAACTKWLTDFGPIKRAAPLSTLIYLQRIWPASEAKATISTKKRVTDMHWSVVPFGKYQGKSFPEIIIRDPDWFFWALPKLYGKLAEEAQELARRARSIKIPRRGRNAWKLHTNSTWIAGFAL